LRELNPEAVIIVHAELLSDLPALYAAGASYISAPRLLEAADLLHAIEAPEKDLLIRETCRPNHPVGRPQRSHSLKLFMKKINTRSALAAAVGAARAAGKIMHANWHLPKRVNSAEAHDIKLELDVRCQKLIQQRLHPEVPEIPLLGEEGISGDMNAEYRWVVDPIDGTVNYFFGMPHAAVSIALEHREKSLVGVIYDPFTDELWTAVRGGKALLNGKQMRVSERAQLKEAIIAMGFSKDKDKHGCIPAPPDPAGPQGEKNPHYGLRCVRAGLRCERAAGCLYREADQFMGCRGRQFARRMCGGEFYSKPVAGKYRYTMCADNGKLRKKLQITSLLK
jgi:hypothetical protein